MSFLASIAPFAITAVIVLGMFKLAKELGL